jgi:hypothetical protein
MVTPQKNSNFFCRNTSLYGCKCVVCDGGDTSTVVCVADGVTGDFRDGNVARISDLPPQRLEPPLQTGVADGTWPHVDATPALTNVHRDAMNADRTALHSAFLSSAL